jgi:hypothetical protein
VVSIAAGDCFPVLLCIRVWLYLIQSVIGVIPSKSWVKLFCVHSLKILFISATAHFFRIWKMPGLHHYLETKFSLIKFIIIEIHQSDTIFVCA